MMTNVIGILTLGLALVAVQTRAADVKLGAAAAPLRIQQWVKGGPVHLADGKGQKIYVVEFWATWCPPCRASIPHLSELQKRFKDQGVVIIGISNETPDKVKPFVAKMGEKMDYVVALDSDRRTSAGYMRAYGQNGIPHAFVVDKKGRVAWHGHPMAGLDKVLEQMIAGMYDLRAAQNQPASPGR